MSLLDTLPHKCTISRRDRVKASGGDGIALESLTAISTDVECWAQQASAKEIRDYQRRGIDIDRKVFFKADPGVSEGYVITLTEKNGVAIASDNQVGFDVISQPDPDASAGLELMWRIDCNIKSSES